MNPTPRTDNIVNRGDIWTATFDYLRLLIVLSRLEVDLGLEGHVVRVALPRTGQINCTWVLTSSQEDLLEKVGSLSSAKLNEIENLILMGDQATV